MSDREYLLKKKFVDLYSIAPNPDNPRKDKDNKELLGSIDEYGMQQPIIVRPREEDENLPKELLYVVVDGDCRLHALLTDPPEDTMLTVGDQVVIRNITKKDAFIHTIQANSLRQDFTDDEYCNIVDRLRKMKYSYRRIAEILGKSIGFVQDRIRYLDASEEVQDKVLLGELNITDLRDEQKVYACIHPEEAVAGDHLEESEEIPKQLDDAAQAENLKQLLQQKKRPYQIFDEDLRYLRENFKQFELLDEKRSGEFIFIQVVWFDSEEEDVFDIYIGERMAKLRKQKESKETEEERTVIFTKDQFNAFSEDATFQQEVKSHQIIGDRVTVVAKNVIAKMDFIKWLIDNIPNYPLTEEQILKYTDLKPVDLAKINKSYVPNADIDFICAAFGYNCYSGDYYHAGEIPRGHKAILWNDASKKPIYESWTQNDRDEIVKIHMRHNCSAKCNQEVLDSYITKYGAEEILEKDTSNKYIEVLLRSPSLRAKFRTWMKKQVGKIPTVLLVKQWEHASAKRDLNGKFFKTEINSHNYELLIFDTADDASTFKELTKRHVKVSNKILKSLQKHQVESMEKAEVLKKGKERMIFHPDESVLVKLEEHLEKMKFDSTGLEELDSKIFNKTALEDVPIPQPVYFKVFSGKKADIDQLIALAKELEEFGTISINQLRKFSNINHSLSHWNAIDKVTEEKARRKGKQRLKQCDDCLLPKWMNDDETTCSNCRALNSRQHKKNVAAAASSGAGAR